MMKAVEKTRLVCRLLADCDFEEVVKLRGSSISFNMHLRQILSHVSQHPRLKARKKPPRVAMVHVGEPVCGMNAAARAFVIVCLSQGFQPVLIYNSWSGLLTDTVEEVASKDVYLWTGKGGSKLATSVMTADEVGIENIAEGLSRNEISGLVIVGGFAAFESACQLKDVRKHYPELCIPMIVLPATMHNNIPGTDMCLGVDSAVNQICKACDDLKSSALSLRKCVYVVEVGGQNCGCLATLAGIATGADRAFIREEPFTVSDIQDTCFMLKQKLEVTGVKHGLILRNENANPNLTTDFIFRIFNEEGLPQFSARKSVLGDTQESSRPSPYDRAAGLSMGTRATMWLLHCLAKLEAEDGRVYTDSADSLVVLCNRGGKVMFSTVEDLIPQTDFKYKVPKSNWWMEMRPLFNIFSKTYDL